MPDIRQLAKEQNDLLKIPRQELFAWIDSRLARLSSWENEDTDDSNADFYRGQSELLEELNKFLLDEV